MNVTPEIIDVLKRSQINGNALKLPENLSRDLYVKTNKVIESYGGKWDKKAKSHIFSSSPAEKLGLALDAGVVVVEKKVNQKAALQEFFTPSGIAEKVARYADIRRGTKVLEPSAGHGALAVIARDFGATVNCVEINPESAQVLENKGFFVINKDFLDFESPDFYDVILMNPPFAKGQDVTHIRHAYNFLSPGGTIIAITSPSWQFNSQKKFQLFREWFEEVGGVVLEELEAGAFKESGTMVKTLIIKINK